ncbi:MAG: hypothetical protein ACJ74Z_22980 [Bryobacteraceae bacterium]
MAKRRLHGCNEVAFPEITVAINRLLQVFSDKLHRLRFPTQMGGFGYQVPVSAPSSVDTLGVVSLAGVAARSPKVSDPAGLLSSPSSGRVIPSTATTTPWQLLKAIAKGMNNRHESGVGKREGK